MASPLLYKKRRIFGSFFLFWCSYSEERSRPVRKFYSLEEAVALVTAEANKDSNPDPPDDIILDANHDSNSVATEATFEQVEDELSYDDTRDIITNGGVAEAELDADQNMDKTESDEVEDDLHVFSELKDCDNIWNETLSLINDLHDIFSIPLQHVVIIPHKDLYQIPSIPRKDMKNCNESDRVDKNDNRVENVSDKNLSGSESSHSSDGEEEDNVDFAKDSDPDYVPEVDPESSSDEDMELEKESCVVQECTVGHKNDQEYEVNEGETEPTVESKSSRKRKSIKDKYPLLPPCNCNKKCIEKLSEERRKLIHEEYWKRR